MLQSMDDEATYFRSFLAHNKLTQYEEVLLDEGWDSVEFLQTMGHADLKRNLANPPINMRLGHIHKFLVALGSHERAGSSGHGGGAMPLLMPPTPPECALVRAPAPALATRRPMQLIGVMDEDEDEDEDEGDEEDSVVVFWQEGFKYRVPLPGYNTVGDLLEAVRVQAKEDSCKVASRARHSLGDDEWATLVLPRETGAVEHQRILRCADTLAAGSDNYRALKEVPKSRTASVDLADRGLRRRTVHMPHTPHFRMSGDAKVALCDPAHPNMEYDRPDDMRMREVPGDAVELRFYLSDGGLQGGPSERDCTRACGLPALSALVPPRCQACVHGPRVHSWCMLT